MITIDQLLESVDLDFEPRFVTKDLDGEVNIWEVKPVCRDDYYGLDDDNYGEMDSFGKIKLSEFKNKDWQECIYEVPRKETIVRVREREWIGRRCVFWDKYRNIPYYGVLGAIDDRDDSKNPYWCFDHNRWFAQCELDVDKIKQIALPALVDEQIEDPYSRDIWIHTIVGKIAELVDAVNELKGAKNE